MEEEHVPNIRLAEIGRLIDDFEEKFKAGTSDADNFMTMHEIEKLWGELRNNTQNIYTDLLCELMSNVDERDLIRKKKENTHKGGSCCGHT